MTLKKMHLEKLGSLQCCEKAFLMDAAQNDFVFVMMTRFLLEIPFNIVLLKYTFLWRWGDSCHSRHCSVAGGQTDKSQLNTTHGVLAAFQQTAGGDLGGCSVVTSEVPSTASVKTL